MKSGAMVITFQPLQESHFPLLLKWLKMPHVKAWWDQDVHWTPELIKKKYGTYVQGFKRLNLPDHIVEKPMHAFVVYVNGEEIGYIQYYNAYDFPREQGYEIEGLPQNMASLDVFIGEEDYFGKGLGPTIMKQFLKEKVDPIYDACFVDPDTANIQAILVYEKAGFKKVKTVKDGRITWMVKEKPR